MGCHRVSGWPIPHNVLDLHAEFRAHTSGLFVPDGYGLLGALSYFGLGHIAAAAKEDMRTLVLTGGPFSPRQRKEILTYCESDVTPLAALLRAMWPHIDLSYALMRGRYTSLAQSAMEHNGVPYDVEALDLLKRNWNVILDGLFADIDQDYHVFDGHTFKQDRFDAYLARAGIPWPRHESGQGFERPHFSRVG